MASAPSGSKPVTGRVDRNGRLASADPELERLQVEAGSRLGAPLALPQLAAIARTARQLNVPVSRRAVAASRDQDIDMWVRATPDGDEVLLAIDQWHVRPVAGPRLAALSAAESPVPAGQRRWAVDEELRLTDVSEALADLAAIPASEAKGQLLTRLFRLEPGEDGSMPLLAGLAGRARFQGQVASFGPDSSRVFLSGVPIFGGNGEFRGFDGTAEPPGSSGSGPGPNPAPAAGAEAEVEGLLSDPLDRIIESASHIVDRSDGPLRSEYAIYAADISAAAHHLLSVVRAMNRNSADGNSRIDLVDVTREAVSLVESAALERDIAVAVEPVDSCRAQGESRSVTQILVNLIGNAVRHSPAGSAVSISFERRNGTALVHVADNGPGIAAEDQQRIFERFEQGSDAGQGSGLGLAIARRLARGMGGEIELRSRPGEGSRFTLALPVG